MEPIHVESLGAGVQSSTVAMRATAGEIRPMPQGGIFADTQAEPESVYLGLRWLCGVEVKYRDRGGIRVACVDPGEYSSGACGFPIRIVTHGDLDAATTKLTPRKDGTGLWTYAGVPTYTLKPDGSRGIGQRQCTLTYKIEMLDREQRRMIGHGRMVEWRRRHRTELKALTEHKRAVKMWKRAGKVGHPPPLPWREWASCQADPLVVCWLGISYDEVQRMKSARHPWQNFRYPLIDEKWRRGDCLAWMLKNGYPRPPRSACRFCPYHSDEEWRRLRDEEPNEFAAAVQFERDYQAAKRQTKGWYSVPFLHNSRIPLDQVDLSPKNAGQKELDLGMGAECEGMCGV